MARLAFLTLAVLASGCPSDGGDDDDYPVGGGGGGGGTSGPRVDAGTGDGGTGDAQVLIRGRVCVLTDLRKLTNAMPGDCATMGAEGLSVRLGTSAAVSTSDDGSFSIPVQQGTNLVWRVTGSNLATSIVPVSTSTLLPAMRAQAYRDLLGSNGRTLDPGEASIVARIIRNGTPVMSATAVLVGGAGQTLYDGNSATVWAELGTGAFGVAWLPDNLLPTMGDTRSLRIGVGATTYPDVSVPMVDGAITFVTIALP